MSLQGQKLKRTEQKDTFRTFFQRLLLEFNLADKHDGFLWFRIPIGCGISLRTVGVASKPVQPRPLPFAGFFIYVKRKFVANLKVIGSLMWK